MRVEDLNDVASRLRDWIDNADTKTSVLIAIVAIALGFTAREVRDTRDILHGSGITALNVVFLGVWILYLSNVFLALYHALHALSPELIERLKLRPITGRPVITDFRGIGDLTIDEYITAVQNTDEEHLKQELIWLCYQYGQGANHKFKHFVRAMSGFRIALITQVVIFAWITIVLPSGV